MNNSTWVYIRSRGAGVWTVGFYGPDNRWHAESDHKTADAAADRVHWLNGGRDTSDAETIVKLRRDLDALAEQVNHK